MRGLLGKTVLFSYYSLTQALPQYDNSDSQYYYYYEGDSMSNSQGDNYYYTTDAYDGAGYEYYYYDDMGMGDFDEQAIEEAVEQDMSNLYEYQGNDDGQPDMIYEGEAEIGAIEIADEVDDYVFFDPNANKDFGGMEEEDFVDITEDYDASVTEFSHGSQAWDQENDIEEAIPNYENEEIAGSDDPSDEDMEGVEFTYGDEDNKSIEDLSANIDESNVIELSEAMADAAVPINPDYFGEEGAQSLSQEEIEAAYNEMLDEELKEGSNDYAVFSSTGNTLPVAFGFLENVNMHTGEAYNSTSPFACGDISDISEANMCAMRKIRKHKKRKSSNKKYKHGWKSACGKGMKNCKTRMKVVNCERGWLADNKQCGHGCRFEYISSGGQSDTKFNLYQNKKYINCEKCLILSGLVEKHNFAQKALGQMKGGTPAFCDSSVDNTCKAKDLRYAACSGVAVCQPDCWGPGASVEKCKACQKPWCENKTWKQFFAICGSKFDVCMDNYNPDDYDAASDNFKVEGHLECWGTHPDSEKVTYLDVPKTLSLGEQCGRALNPSDYPFVEYQQYFNYCKERVCDLDIDNPEADAVVCDKIWCKNACFMSNGVSRKCLNCDLCRSCPINNMAVIGNYDRKLHDGQPNSIVYELGVQEVLPKLWRPAIDEMNEQHYQLLPGNGCTSCNLRYERVTCRDMCNKLEKYVLAGVSNQDPMYRWAQSVCRSNRCVIHLSQACDSCIKTAVKNAKKEWKTALGTSERNNNFNGQGCALDCVPMKMSKISEYAGVNIQEVWAPDVQNALALMGASEKPEFSSEQIEALHEWANNDEMRK